jgi:hypothetical protein
MPAVVCLQESSNLLHGVAVQHCRATAAAEHSGQMWSTCCVPLLLNNVRQASIEQNNKVQDSLQAWQVQQSCQGYKHCRKVARLACHSSALTLLALHCWQAHGDDSRGNVCQVQIKAIWAILEPLLLPRHKPCRNKPGHQNSIGVESAGCNADSSARLHAQLQL